MNQKVSVWLFVWLLFCSTAFGHSGGLDSRGGHKDSKNGGYHFHPERFNSPPPVAPPPAANFRSSARTSAKIVPRTTARLNTKAPPKLRFTVLKKRTIQGKAFARVRLEQDTADAEQLKTIPSLIFEDESFVWVYLLKKDSDELIGVVSETDEQTEWDSRSKWKDPWGTNGRFAIREWSNENGSFKRFASFESSDGTTVTLTDDKGKLINIGFVKLCESDRKWIEERDRLLPPGK